MTGEQTGLSRDLVKYLNEKLGGEPRLELWLVNRARLALEMSDPGFDGLVAWVNPAWVGDPQRELYLWTFPIMRDTNELISSVARPVIYRGPDSLKGMTFGGIEGIAIRASTRRRPGAIWCGSMPRRSRPTSACWCAVAST